jgi:hypothetical protein
LGRGLRLHEDYLKLADEEFSAASYLFEGGYLREAASRAYFSMFHAAKALLYLREKYPKTHAGVISKFGEEFVKSGEIEKVYGEMLAQAETLRAKADYDIEREITEVEVEDVLDSCEKFLEKVSEVAKELAK